MPDVPGRRGPSAGGLLVGETANDLARPMSHQQTGAARTGLRIPRPDTAASLSQGLGNAALLRLLRGGAVRRKKLVSDPGDQAELEADQVARKISRADGGCGGSCAGCSNAFVQRARAPDAGNADVAAVASDIGPGRALEPAHRRLFEQRLGVPLERTRVHTGNAAAQSAKAIGANAYTVGSDVVFAAGQYAPDTVAGRELLAHELTHVAQAGDRAVAGDTLAHRQAAPGGTVTDQGLAHTDPQAPHGQIYYYRGVAMSGDAGFMRGELRRLVAKAGLLGAEGWYQAMVRDRGIPQEESQRTALGITAHTIGGRPNVRSPIDVQREMRLAQEDERLAVTAMPVVIQVYPEVREEAVRFLATFQEALRQTLVTTLRESEKRIQVERIRYGITKTGEWGTTEYKAENTVAFQGIVGAAKDLLATRQHINALWTQRRQLTGSLGKGGTFVRAENQPRYDQISAEMAQLEEQYAQELAGASLRYPALGAVLDQSGARSGEERLEALASGKLSSKVGSHRMGWRGHVGAGAVGEVLDSRQRAIDKVRDEVNDDQDRLWKLDSIVALTKMRMGASRLTMADKLIADKIEQIKADESWLAIALGVIAFALALIAAIPTAGASLAVTAVVTTAAVGTLAVSGYQLVKDIKEYQLQLALTNTDLNRRAYAISTEEPSMFWVALDLVFFISDGVGALKAFRALKNNARLALLAREGTDAAEAAARLEEAAKGVQGAKPGLGRKLLDSLAELRKRPEGVRSLGKVAEAEATAVARGGEVIAEEAKQAATIANVGVHEVKVTRSGHLVICTDCAWLRERFAQELADNADLLHRLERAETAAKQVGTSLNAATKSEVAALSQELERARQARLLAEGSTESATAVEESAKGAKAEEAPLRGAVRRIRRKVGGINYEFHVTPRSAASFEAIPTGNTVVYTVHGGGGEIVYVGITTKTAERDALDRLAEHLYTKEGEFIGDASEFRIIGNYDRELEAHALEQDIVTASNPKYNKDQTPWATWLNGTPWAKERKQFRPEWNANIPKQNSTIRFNISIE